MKTKSLGEKKEIFWLERRQKDWRDGIPAQQWWSVIVYCTSRIVLVSILKISVRKNISVSCFKNSPWLLKRYAMKMKMGLCIKDWFEAEEWKQRCLLNKRFIIWRQIILFILSYHSISNLANFHLLLFFFHIPHL